MKQKLSNSYRQIVIATRQARVPYLAFAFYLRSIGRRYTMPTIEELKFLQSQSLERKIMIKQTRIIEWYQRWNGQVYVSFSAGKDSTVLLDGMRRIYPDVEAVFIDTGLEYPEIREFAKTFENVTIVRPKMQFHDVIATYGYPVISKEVSQVLYEAKRGGKAQLRKLNGEKKDKKGNKSPYNCEKYKYLLDAPFDISHMCCNIMKKKPAKDFERQSGKKAIIGTMSEESMLRQSEWLQTGCNGFDGKRPLSKPMSFWTEQDVLHYLKLTGIPYASVYGDIVPKAEFSGQLSMDDIPTDLMTTGCKGTGCMFCMFGVHLEPEPNRFQKMKITHPKQYDYCMGGGAFVNEKWMPDKKGLGMAKVLDYIGVKY
jgi:3'-phosphoadenosine 5'-phosphosulfate sulfotransferase (PAPS reductase)/FAD synthetase